MDDDAGTADAAPPGPTASPVSPVSPVPPGPADAAPPAPPAPTVSPVPPASTSPLAPPGGPAPRPARRALRPADLHALDFVLDVFLPEAWARGLAVPAPAEARSLLDELAAEARLGGRPGQHQPWAPAMPTPGFRPVRPATYPVPPVPPADPYPVTPVTPVGAPAQPPTPSTTPPSTTPPGLLLASPTLPRPLLASPATPRPMLPSPAPWPSAPPRPTPVHDWWQGFRRTVGSDLGVHGLAYLGVLLLFVGVFGLVAFAFGEVTPGMRPVAELSVATVPFLGARLLIGHGAAVVGRALEVVGGLLLPIMAITSLVDGYAVPPNPTGTALVVSLAAVCTACAVGYAFWTRRHPASGLRHAVAPTVWLAAAMATIGVGRAMPSGQDVAVPSSHQGAAMAAALAVTLLAARLRPEHRLAEATRASAVPGLVVITLLAVLSWFADGVVVLPVALTGVFLLVALDLAQPRVPALLVDAVGPVWVGVVALVLGSAPDVSGHAVVAGAVVGFVALIERAGRREALGSTIALPTAGLVIALLIPWPATWWTVGTLVVVTAWVVARRVRPLVGAAGEFDAAAAVLPILVAVSVGQLASVGWGVGVAGGIVLLATVPATRDVLGRGAGDRFWPLWWRWAVALVAPGVAALWADVSTAERWVIVGTLVALGGAAIVGPVGRSVRPWVVTGLLMSGWVLGCATADGVPAVIRGGVPALAALAMVGAAGRSRASWGLAGHLLGAVAIGFGGPGWGVVVTVSLATATWAVTALAGEWGTSAVADALSRADARLRFLPWSLVALGLPVAVGATLHTAGALAWPDPWRVLVPTVVAVGYAGVARGVAAERPRAVAAGAAFAAALVGVALTTQPWPGVVALGALVTSVALIPPDRRRAPMVWVAWLAVAPLVALLAHGLSPAFRDLSAATATAGALAAVGAVELVGGTAVLRDRMRGDLGAARGVGILELGLGLTVAVLAVPQPTAGRMVLGVMVVLLVLAVQTRVGTLGAAALVGAWAAVVSLTWPGLGCSPWVSVLVAVGLLAAAELAHQMLPDNGRWTRWDVPVLLAAAPVACTALVAAADGDARAVTFTAVGGLTVAVGVRLRAMATRAELLGAVGSGLVLLGADDAGRGWLALALLALAAAHTGLATRAGGAERTARQLVGAAAAVAAWGAGLDWLAVSTQEAVDASAAASAAVLLSLAGMAHLRWIGRSWPLVWGGAASAVLGTAAIAAVGAAPAAEPSILLAVAVGAAAGAWFAAAGPLVLPGLRDLAAWAGLAAVLLGLAAFGVDRAGHVSVLSVLGVVVTAAALPVALRDRTRARPAVELGAGAVAVAVVVAFAALPDSALLVTAIAACAVQVAAAGVALRSLPLQVAAPVLACVAWLMSVAHPDRAPEWYTVAVGLTLLTVVAVWRRDLRRRLLDPAAAEVVAVEIAGIAFLVVASLVRAVTTSPVHAAVVVAIGVGVAVWGVATRVRRRLAAGVLVVGVGVVLLVAVPLVGLLPAWGGPAGWVMLACVGLIALSAATMIERGRTAVRSAKGRVGALTAGWE